MENKGALMMSQLIESDVQVIGRER